MIAMRAVPAWGLRPLLQRRDCSAFPPLHLIRLTNSSTMWQSIPIGPGLTVVGSSNVLRSTLTVEGLQEQLEGIAADEAESTAEAAKFLKEAGGRRWRQRSVHLKRRRLQVHWTHSPVLLLVHPRGQR